MNIRSIPPSFSLSSTLFSIALLASSPAAVTPGGTFTDKAIITESTGGETLARATAGTGLGPVLVHDFDTPVAVDGSYELTAPTTLALSSGRHLVMYATRFDKSAGSNRAEIISNITLAGTQLEAGTSQGFIRRLGGADETVMSGGAIINVAADDDVLTLESRRSDTNTDTNLPAREPNYTSAQLLKLDDTWPYLNLQRTTNQGGTIGVTGADVIYDTDNSAATHGSAFTYTAGSADITLNETGLYLVFANTKLEKTAGNNTRANYHQSITLNGTAVAGSTTTTYLRGNANGENAQSGVAAVGRIISATAGQVLRVRLTMESGGVASTIQGNGTAITAVKLPVSAKYVEVTDTTNQNVLNTAATAIGFDSQVSGVNTTFTHGGSSTVTANNAGDYLFLGSLFTQADTTNDNQDRVIPITRWRQNGSTILDRGQGAAYNRDNGGNRTSGSWNSTLITLGASDTVELTSENVGTASAAFPNTPSMQGLEIASLVVNNDPAIAVNLPITVIPSTTGNVISDAFLDTFDNDTVPSGLTYTVDSVPAAGTLNLSASPLGMGGTFTQDDIDNGLVTFDAGASAPVVGGFDFTVSDGTASDSSSFVINVAFPPATITIASNGDVTEGNNAVWTVTSSAAPTGLPLTVNITYSGAAADGSDFTGVASIDIPVGATSANLSVATIVDGLLEGCEPVVASIGTLTGGELTASAGSPSSAFIIIDDANSAPTGTELTQIQVGTGTIPLNDIVVSDGDTTYASTVTTPGAPLTYYTGSANVAIFGDGRAQDDAIHDLDAGGPALNAALGYSVEIDFIAQAADLVGSTVIWEIGGSSNGSAIILVEGVPHLLVKAGGTAANQPTDDASTPGVFTDLNWATDNTIVVPLTTTALTAGSPNRLAVIFSDADDDVEYSVNGAASATVALLNNDNNNWRGDHTVNISTNAGTGIGGNSSVSTPINTFSAGTIKNPASGTATVSCLKFWDESTGSITNTAGTNDEVTVTMTIDNWSATAGDLTAASGNGETYASGVWSITGDSATVNTALTAAEFVTGAGTADPTVINILIEDGDEDGSGPTVGSIIITGALPDPLYVDDDLAGTPAGTAVTDVDGGAPVAPATMAYNAFATIGEALAVVSPTGTIIVNDGDYSTEAVTLTDSITLQLTGSGDTSGGSTVTIASLASGAGVTGPVVDLGAETLVTGGATDTAYEGTIRGTGGNLTKVGTGRFTLRNTTTHTGTTTVNEGFLRIGHVVTPLIIGTLDGDGPVVVNSPGALEFAVGTDLTQTQTGVISGTGEVIKLADGTLIFDGPSGNTFSGGFELGDGGGSLFDGTSGAKGGFVVLNHSDHLGTGLVHSRGAQLQAGSSGIVIPNDFEIDAGGFRLGGSNDFELSGTITNINNDPRGWGNYGLEGLNLTFSGTAVLPTTTGTLNFEGSEGKDNGTWTITGDITGIGSVLFQNNFDNGIVTISGTNTYSGTTVVNTAVVGGTLIFNGSHTGGGNYTINNNAIFTGTGSTASAVTIGASATLSPGDNGIGTMSTGTLTINGTLAVDVDNTAGVAGTDWDQVDVTGAVTLGAAAGLTVTESSTVEASPADIVVISNDAANAVNGTFGLGLPFAGDYLGSGLSGDAGYTGGDGNDVILTTGAAGIIGSWRTTNFGSSANTGNGENLSDAGDSDGLTNLLEFAFGTDPNLADQANLMLDGSVNGVPIVNADFSGAGVAFDAVFVRRDDFGDSGSANYTVQFSSDLATWHDSTDTPTVVADSTDDSDYEIVSVPYPFFTPDGKKARFFRVQVTLIP
ncbi:hypothetical protein OAK89_03410 [Akkermansiaceae bacterium]|nr:hypothetical protein [Akkermansiaceae bacterium]